MKTLISGIVFSVILLGGFASTSASAASCVAGEEKYIREVVDNGNDRGREENVRYVCVNGSFYKNGKVPNYPAPCKNGTQKVIKEMEDYGNHTREVNVTYVCKGGVYYKNGRVPNYPAPCANGTVKMIKERQERGNHSIEVDVPYVCRGGVYRKQ